MSDIFLICKVIFIQNKMKVLKCCALFSLLLIGYLLLLFTGYKGSYAFLYALIYFPFIYCWYNCASMKLDFFHATILTRDYNRTYFFIGNLIFMCFPILFVWVAALLLMANSYNLISFSEIFIRTLFVLMMLTIDFFLLISLSYGLCILGHSGLSFFIVFLPVLLAFKSPKLIAVMQVNYSFPLIPGSLENMAELYDYLGGNVHVTENIICALVFLWICHYFYKTTDI